MLHMSRLNVDIFARTSLSFLVVAGAVQVLLHKCTLLTLPKRGKTLDEVRGDHVQITSLNSVKRPV
jgi:hypothetical protein